MRVSMTRGTFSVAAVKVLTMAFFCIGSDAWAFDVETHGNLNRRAAELSAVDNSLKTRLGLVDGLVHRVNGEQVREWIRKGGAAEDEFLGSEKLGALFRSRHHFHNPLLPWDQAGLNSTSVCPPFVLRGEASVSWAQNRDQGVSGKAAWGDARDAFYNALTRASKSGEDGRDRHWADTFRILGQQAHLVADLAVPAHTRNDQHCPEPDGFEDWAARNRELAQGLIAAPLTKLDVSIFKVGAPIADPIARAPIARLWDTDRYTPELNNPDVTLNPPIGLAEYTNANFFSDDTVFSPSLPFPAVTSVDLKPQPEEAPRTGGERRRYFTKDRHGQKIDHLAVPSALYRFLSDALRDRKAGLDDKVFHDYANHLLPRAVGYSAALLDYFFRGALTVEQVSWDEDGVFIDVVNDSDEAMEGQFDLWAIYGPETEGEERKHLVELGRDVRLSAFGGRSFRIAVPTTASPTADYVLVFRGRLGDEEDAVVGRVFTVPHALVIQQEYRADLTGVCSRTGQTFLPSRPDYVFEFGRYGCTWQTTNHALSGQIVTNSPRAILQRIEARWFGRFPGQTPLTLGGRTYAGGVWEREGTEPDPTSFSIADPARRDGAILLFMIDFVGGGFLETSLAALGPGISAHEKQIVLHDPGPDEERTALVMSGRGVSLSVTYNWSIEGEARRPLFRATSISGRTNPTDTVTVREFHSFGFGEGVSVTSFMFSEEAIDDFIVLPPGPPSDGTREPFLAIEPLRDPQTSLGPFITWQADVDRVYQPYELDFLRAFMTANPPRYSIPLRGTPR